MTMMMMIMEGELGRFTKVWLSVSISLTYCYIIGKVTSKPTIRLFSILPIICFFLWLPLNLQSIHLGGSSAFFIAWLANFKLLMFAFDKGPLATDPSISLLSFLAIACLPIKIQQNPSQNSSHGKTQNAHQNHPSSKVPQKGHKSFFNYSIKILLLAIMLKIYDYSEHLPQKVIWVLYSFHIYFLLEIILAIVAIVARAVLGMELEPQFNEPYLSTSLQDFWGKRWNIMVTRILRPSVYDPVHAWATRAVGRKYAPLPAVFSTFLVSAVMHELIFYYLGRVKPTWEITWFFLFHGVCLMVEIAVKKESKLNWKVPRPVASCMTMVFVMTTAFLWFLPPLLRCRADMRAFEEYAAIGAFAKDVGQVFTFKALNVSKIHDLRL